MDYFDYVIVGAGSSGSVVAGRLAEGGGSTICVLEAGPPVRTLFIPLPAGVMKIRTNSRYRRAFVTEPGLALDGRSVTFIQGHVVGGSGSINGMVYTRGQAADFDNWAQRGNRGWSYADVLPYFRRSERRIGAGDDRLRGRDGPIEVTDPLWRDPLTDSFIETGANLGFPRNDDYNGARQDGVGRFQFTIDGAGWRTSAARAFLGSTSRRRIELRSDAKATGLVLDGRRIVGVRYRREGSPEIMEVRARKEVILCAGTVQTPKLLQLSGIGPAALLRDLGIDVVKDLPGVGENLQDHYCARILFRIKAGMGINGVVNGAGIVGEIARWLLRRPSILNVGPVLGYAFCKTDPALDRPDYLLNFTPGSMGAGGIGGIERKPGMTIAAIQLRPESTGWIRARSKDPLAAPAVQPNYLTAATDRRVLLAATKMIRRFAATSPLADHVVEETSPGPRVRTDADLLEFARATGDSGHHLVGTCRMGPDGDAGAVVDDQLHVRGVSGLRIADCSVMPTITSGNTNAPALMIAEKAADLILGRGD